MRESPVPVVILLGAGGPHHGAAPSALHSSPDQRRVLDVLIDAFSDTVGQCHFVGGYHVDEVAERYPQLSYSINRDWQTTGSVGSLLMAPLDEARPHFVSYTDIVFDRALVPRLGGSAADVVLAVDRGWRNRYRGRTPEDLRVAEKLTLSDDRVTAIGARVVVAEADAEFAGVAWLSAAAVTRVLALRDQQGDRLRRSGLPVLFQALVDSGLDVRAVDVEGQWAELNAPQDLARFVMGSKADTLERLRPRVRASRIGEQVSFEVRDWRTASPVALGRIGDRFGGHEVIVRSSSLREDAWCSANAGAFDSVPSVRASDHAALTAAIDQVIASYSMVDERDQVLVQRMVEGVQISGVAFTRTLSHGGPYYTVEYEVGEATDAVTSGRARDPQVLVVRRSRAGLPSTAHPLLGGLLPALHELEERVGHDCLDVEFAIDGEGTVHVLQVRPIVVNHEAWRTDDSSIDATLDAAVRSFRASQQSSPFVPGRRTLYGVMPDWNPAEIIGIKPRRLALSLYRYLVTDDIWARQRAEFGYRDVRPLPLMVTFAGHPYVDVRASLASFLPAEIPDDLAGRLVDLQLDRLETHPELFDKIEFEIAQTALTFDFEERTTGLSRAGIEDAEVRALEDALRAITRRAFTRWEQDRVEIEVLEARCDRILDAGLPPLTRASLLLEDSRERGTLPFAHLARGAFVAMALLRSAVAEGIVAESSLRAFLGSLRTVAHHFAEDCAEVAAGRRAWPELVGRYGHLRPGTYEIQSPSYAEDPKRFLEPLLAQVRVTTGTGGRGSFSEGERRALAGALRGLGLPDDPERFEAFARGALEGREYAKFAFTRNVSAALSALGELGAELGLSRECLSHVSLEDFLAIQRGPAPPSAAAWLEGRGAEGLSWHLLSQCIELPPLLVHEGDFDSFFVPRSAPNFVGSRTVTAPVVEIRGEGHPPSELAGRIVLAPQADPGYDWLFGHAIAGLVTAYGGTNSHMAIRAAEFQLPAAIGTGERLYARLARAAMVRLDCENRRIEILR